MLREPNFFLVGAPKAGTTSLYHYLDQHPQIYMSPIKEPHYFADEIRSENLSEEMQSMDEPNRDALCEYLRGPMAAKFSGGPVDEWADYLRLFQNVNGEKAIGEASVCYLWSKTAPVNIAAKFPGAKILMVLRSPADRAFAQYVHMLTFAKSRVSFREHMDAFFSSSSRRIGKLYPFLEFGLYAEQVKRYFARFPRDRIQILFYEDYVKTPLALLQDIFRFLNVNDGFEPDLSNQYMQARVPRLYFLNRLVKRLGLWERARALAPAGARHVAFQSRKSLALAPEDRARLTEYYREDTRNLANLIDKDLSAWL